MLTMRRVVWGRPILSAGPTVMDGHIRQCTDTHIRQCTETVSVFHFRNTLRITLMKIVSPCVA
jgi:hypothetical protein